MTLDKTALLPEGLEATRKRLQEILDGFDEDSADALETGTGRGDLWTDIEIPVGDLRSVLAALRSIPPDDGCQPVGYLKPKHPAAVEPFYIDAADRTEDWQKAVFTIPVFSALPPPPEAV